jgi:hypothetical protein
LCVVFSPILSLVSECVINNVEIETISSGFVDHSQALDLLAVFERSPLLMTHRQGPFSGKEQTSQIQAAMSAHDPSPTPARALANPKPQSGTLGRMIVFAGLTAGCAKGTSEKAIIDPSGVVTALSH